MLVSSLPALGLRAHSSLRTPYAHAISTLTDSSYRFITTISAWTEPGCKNADNDPHAKEKGKDFVAGLPGWCSTKKAGAVFLWFVFSTFLISSRRIFELIVMQSSGWQLRPLSYSTGAAERIVTPATPLSRTLLKSRRRLMKRNPCMNTTCRASRHTRTLALLNPPSRTLTVTLECPRSGLPYRPTKSHPCNPDKAWMYMAHSLTQLHEATRSQSMSQRAFP